MNNWQENIQPDNLTSREWHFIMPYIEIGSWQCFWQGVIKSHSPAFETAKWINKNDDNEIKLKWGFCGYMDEILPIRRKALKNVKGEFVLFEK